MNEKIYYTGNNPWLKSFDHFEKALHPEKVVPGMPPGFVAGSYIGVMDGGRMIGFSKELQDDIFKHHRSEPLNENGKLNLLGRLQRILESQTPSAEWVPIKPDIQRTEDGYLHIDCKVNRISFVFDHTGEMLLGIVNIKE